jgi:acetylornithine/succinyldiaminopimelate/putrescine aminotransferase
MNMMSKDPPAVSEADYSALERQYGTRNYEPFNVVLTRGLGVWVWDVDGRRYLDCLSAYSAVNQGHCHPRILAALTEQAARYHLSSFHERPTPAVLPGALCRDPFAQGSADELRCRSGGNRD